jgi:hypothetical protein
MKFNSVKITIALALLVNTFSINGFSARVRPKDDLVPSTQALSLEIGDTLIDKHGRRMKITGFDQKGLIAVNNRDWVNSLKKIAVAKGSRDGFSIGDRVYDTDYNQGKILGFYADGKVCWSGPDIRIKTSKLTHLQSNRLAALSTERKHRHRRSHCEKQAILVAPQAQMEVPVLAAPCKMQQDMSQVAPVQQAQEQCPKAPALQEQFQNAPVPQAPLQMNPFLQSQEPVLTTPVQQSEAQAQFAPVQQQDEPKEAPCFQEQDQVQVQQPVPTPFKQCASFKPTKKWVTVSKTQFPDSSSSNS